jgi:hypothetical protein
VPSNPDPFPQAVAAILRHRSWWAPFKQTGALGRVPGLLMADEPNFASGCGVARGR